MMHSVVMAATAQTTQLATAPSLVCLGSSGYIHAHWKGIYYPRRVDPFDFYASEFDAVELNSPFYRVPADSTWDKWRQVVSRPSFTYVVKANRFFTHMKQFHLDQVFQDRWKSFYEGCKRLGDHLGAVLFQLAPRTRCSVEKLNSLAKILPRHGRFLFEFRHPTWFCREVFKVLAENDWCLAAVHINNQGGWAGELKSGWHPHFETYDPCCAWGAYIRLHGTGGQYFGNYSSLQIGEMASRVQEWAAHGRQVFVMCNNTDEGTPPSAIVDLRNLSAELVKMGVIQEPTATVEKAENAEISETERQEIDVLREPKRMKKVMKRATKKVQVRKKVKMDGSEELEVSTEKTKIDEGDGVAD